MQVTSDQNLIVILRPLQSLALGPHRRLSEMLLASMSVIQTLSSSPCSAPAVTQDQGAAAIAAGTSSASPKVWLYLPVTFSILHLDRAWRYLAESDALSKPPVAAPVPSHQCFLLSTEQPKATVPERNGLVILLMAESEGPFRCPEKCKLD